MELQNAQIQNYTLKDINYIKTYFKNPIDLGSEITCYRLNSKQVLKIFNNNIDLSTKLFIPDSVYGNNTYIFIDKIIKYYSKIYAYTMKYVRGPNISNPDSISLFYKLSYSMLLEYITILLNDSKSISNHGIEVFDCFQTNIILSPTGFRQVDCVDFIYKDKDPSLIEKENIHLMCQTIYDCLISPYLSTFISNNNLKPGDFTTSPYDFIKELKIISQQYSDTEIITLGDTKKLSRKKIKRYSKD